MFIGGSPEQRSRAMAQFGIGQPVRRVEDRRFLTGSGRYVDDLTWPHQAYAFMLRSPHAHARIRAIDTAAAAAAPGVLAVYTGADLARDGIGTIPCLSPLQNRDGSPAVMPPRPALVRERVRHVGDTVAMVVADTLAAARDAAELIAVDYEPLPATVPRARAPPRRRAIASPSNSSITASSSPRWSRAARSGRTIPERSAIPCGARRRARIFCATCSPRASSTSRKTASASSPPMSAAASA